LVCAVHQARSHPNKETEMPKMIASVSPLASISSSDLLLVSGGGLFGESASPNVTNTNTTNTNTTNTTQQLVCPAGTTPRRTDITGNLTVDLPAVKGQGNMTYSQFSCDPLPQTVPQTNSNP
jgi:hypothetical protein